MIMPAAGEGQSPQVTSAGRLLEPHRLPDFPQWIPALVALIVVVAVNLMSVKAFGEFEFWAALLKVTALVAFLVIGIGLVATAANIGGHTASVSNLWRNGGFFPEGWLAPLLVTQGVIFA
jgi:L-asparagine permease